MAIVADDTSPTGWIDDTTNEPVDGPTTPDTTYDPTGSVSVDVNGVTYTEHPDGTYTQNNGTGDVPSSAQKFAIAQSGGDPEATSTIPSSQVSATPTTSRTTQTVTGTNPQVSASQVVKALASGDPNAGKLASAFLAQSAGSITGLAALSTLFGSNTPKTAAYQGSIPTLTALRSQVNSGVPAGQGQQYFTDTTYVNPSDASAVAAAKAANSAQSDAITAAAQQLAAKNAAAQPAVAPFAMPWVNQTAYGNTPVTQGNNAGLPAVVNAQSPAYNQVPSTGIGTPTPVAKPSTPIVQPAIGSGISSIPVQPTLTAPATAPVAPVTAPVTTPTTTTTAKTPAATTPLTPAQTAAQQYISGLQNPTSAAVSNFQSSPTSIISQQIANAVAQAQAANPATANKTLASLMDQWGVSAQEMAAATGFTTNEITNLYNQAKGITAPAAATPAPTIQQQLSTTAAALNSGDKSGVTALNNLIAANPGLTITQIQAMFPTVDLTPYLKQGVVAPGSSTYTAPTAATIAAAPTNALSNDVKTIGGAGLAALSSTTPVPGGSNLDLTAVPQLINSMRQSGMSDTAIVQNLKSQGLTPDQISTLMPETGGGVAALQAAIAASTPPGTVVSTVPPSPATPATPATPASVAAANNAVGNSVSTLSTPTGIAAIPTPVPVDTSAAPTPATPAASAAPAAPQYTSYTPQQITDYFAQNPGANVALAEQQFNADPAAVNAAIAASAPPANNPLAQAIQNEQSAPAFSIDTGPAGPDMQTDNSSFGYDTAKAGGLMDLHYAQGGSTPMQPRYLQGTTDGMADKIPSSIDGIQPAKLSHGEFVIPADVVSHLGNGNSDAGAKKLYQMMNKIRMARTGNPKQGKEINPDKFMLGGSAYATGGEVAFKDGGVLGFSDSTGAVPTPTAPSASSGTSTPSLGYSTVNALTPYVGDYVTQMLGQGQALANAPMPVYTGELSAGPSTLQNQQFAGLQALAGTGAPPVQFTNPYNAPAPYNPLVASTQNFTNTGAIPIPSLQTPSETSLVSQAASGQPFNQATGSSALPALGNQSIASQYMNPYLQSSLAPQLDALTYQAQQDQQSMLGNLTKQGAFGGSRQAVAQGVAQGNLLTNQAGLIGKGYDTAYTNAMNQFNADQNRQLQAQQANIGQQQFGATQAQTAAQNQAQYEQAAQQNQQTANMASANFGLSTLGALGTAGATQQGLAQAADTASLNQYNQQQQYPYAQLQFEQSLLTGLPITTQSVVPNTSTLSNITNTGAGLSTLYNSLNNLTLTGAGGANFGTPSSSGSTSSSSSGLT